MKQTRWGILGPGSIAHNFADGLKEATSGALLAISSRNSERLRQFGDHYGIADSQTKRVDYDSGSIAAEGCTG